jgi:hypothetical protein
MISQYSQPLQSLNQPGITPLPFEDMMKAGQYVQKRYDDSVNATEDQFTQVASSNIIDAQKTALDNIKGTFSNEMSALMEKYKGQTYSSDFQRDSKKLISKMASDPTVKMLRENKAQYEFDDATARQMHANGIEYYDPRLNQQEYLNADGTPKQYKAGVRALKHDNMIEEQGAKILQAMVQSGSTTNNYKQIDRAVAAGTSENSPIFKDKKASLIQQGYTEKDASKAAKEYITQRFNTFRKQDIDAQMLDYNLKLRELAAKQEETNNLGTSGGVWKNPGRPEAREDHINTVSNLVDRLGKGEDIMRDPSAWEDWKSGVAKGNMAYRVGLDDQNFKDTPGKEQAKQVFNAAIKYFGTSATQFKTYKDLLTAYRDGMKTQYSSGPSESVKFTSDDKNKTMIPHLRGSGLKIYSTNEKGFTDENASGTQEKLASFKDDDLYFGGIVDFNPTGESKVSFKLKDKAGKEYSVPVPDDLAQRDFPLVSKLGAAREYTGPVASTNSNMLPKDYWTTKQHNGINVTYVPIRTFDGNNSPKIRIAVIPGATTEDKYSDIENSIKAIEEMYKTNPKEASRYLTTPSAAMNSELEDYYNGMQGLNKK